MEYEMAQEQVLGIQSQVWKIHGANIGNVSSNAIQDYIKLLELIK